MPNWFILEHCPFLYKSKPDNLLKDKIMLNNFLEVGLFYKG